MHSRESGPNFWRGVAGVVAVTTLSGLGGAACGSGNKSAAEDINPRDVIEAVGIADTAIILPNLKRCPTIKPDGVTSEDTGEPAVDIAQAYVGSPNRIDQHGNITTLHAAHVTTTYTVEDNKNKAVYCGPDNQANGASFEGVMIVAATDPGLITTPSNAIMK